MDVFLHDFISGLMLNLFHQVTKSFTCCCRYPYQRCMFQKSTGKLLPHIFFHHLQPFFIHKITFIQHNDTLLNSEKIQNIHVFSCLWHDSFIRCNYQKYQVHSDNSGNHIVDKFLMSGYIDDPRAVSARQIKIGKPQIDRNSSALFFFPAVCISSGQCFDQCRLTMINMSGRSDNNILHSLLSHLPFFFFFLSK